MNSRLAVSFVAVLLYFCGTPNLAYAQNIVKLAEKSQTRVKQPIVIEIDMPNIDKMSYRINKPRITENDEVKFHIKHYNFIRYSIDASISKDTVKEYITLSSLWNSLLKPNNLFSELKNQTFLPNYNLQDSITEVPQFLPQISVWRNYILNANDTLRKKQNDFPAERTIRHSDSSIIAKQLSDVTLMIDSLTSQKATILKSITKDGKTASEIYYRFQIYSILLQENEAIITALKKYMALLNLTINGKIIEVGKIGSGTEITLSLVGKDSEGKITYLSEYLRGNGKDTIQNLTVKYFVNSSQPFTYHIGSVFTSLADVNYEKIRTVMGIDAYRLKDSSNISALSAFVTWQIPALSSEQDVSGIGLTLGTDIITPGKRLYAGFSLPLDFTVPAALSLINADIEQGQGRFIVTGGIVLGSKTNPSEPVIGIDNGYKYINSLTSLGWFVSFSIRPY